MPGADLISSEWAVAFGFSRSTAAVYRDAAGNDQLAAVDAPRFDHDSQGTPLGLLVSPGPDLGQEDRLALDPLILPAALAEGTSQEERACTIFHIFTPEGADAPEHRAWYSREAQRTIEALLRQSGHHATIGLVAGFRENLGGTVRFRQRDWQLTGTLAAPGGVLGNGDGKPVITAGAERIDA